MEIEKKKTAEIAHKESNICDPLVLMKELIFMEHYSKNFAHKVLS